MRTPAPHSAGARAWPLAGLLVAGLIVAACGDGAGPPARVPASLLLEPTSLTIDDLGTGQLSVRVLDQNGQPFAAVPPGLAIEWASAATGIASVDGNGGVSGQHPGTAEISATARPGDFRATAMVTVRAVATGIAYVDGDGQAGFAGEPLAQPVVVRALDRHGNGVGGVAVTFVVTGGGGTVAHAEVATAADGRAQTVWTLGPSQGAQSLEARATGLDGSPLHFQATASVSAVQLTAIAPDPLVRGASATLTGSGFSVVPNNNQVLFDGVEATVLEASATQLVVRVPLTCRPAGHSAVSVHVAGQPSNVLQHPVVPAGALSLAIGQQLVLGSGDPFCIHFAPTAAAEAYLVGVQSVAEAVSFVTPITVRGLAASAPLAGAPLPQPTAASVRGEALPGGADAAPPFATIDAHLAAEQALRAWERAWLEPRMHASLARLQATTHAAAAAANASIPATVAVGDVVDVRVGSFGSGNICQNFTTIAAVVRKVGAHGIWVEDGANPSGGFSAADFDELSAFFDQDVYPVIAGHFGAPTDIDANQRVVIVATKEVNRNDGLGGFASTGDLFPRSLCPASNQGEYYYAQVPDPTGLFGAIASRANVLRNTKRLLPHEVTHVIQLGRRMQHPAATGFQTTWELEGQATLAEELIGHQLTGRAPGQNYGQIEAWNSPPSTEVWWYAAFGYLAQYFGFESNTSKASGAPEQCTFLGGARNGNNGPCINPNFNYYGAAWSFLRWLSDHYGGALPGGEAALHRALIESPHVGLATVAAVAGTPAHALLAEWAAALYLDDRVAGMHPRLGFTSWNLFDVMDSRVPAARLQPRERGFAAFADDVSVRAGSTAYFRISGSGRPSTTLEIGEDAGKLLPPYVQVWIVRTQ